MMSAPAAYREANVLIDVQRGLRTPSPYWPMTSGSSARYAVPKLHSRQNPRPLGAFLVAPGAPPSLHPESRSHTHRPRVLPDTSAK
eukprot:9102699-Pyramimonas_sp.AAC.1